MEPSRGFTGSEDGDPPISAPPSASQDSPNTGQLGDQSTSGLSSGSVPQSQSVPSQSTGQPTSTPTSSNSSNSTGQQAPNGQPPNGRQSQTMFYFDMGTGIPAFFVNYTMTFTSPHVPSPAGDTGAPAPPDPATSGPTPVSNGQRPPGFTTRFGPTMAGQQVPDFGARFASQGQPNANGGTTRTSADGTSFVYQFPIDIPMPFLERKPRASDRAVEKLKKLNLDDIPEADRTCSICFDPYVKCKDIAPGQPSSNVPESDMTDEVGDPPESVPVGQALDPDAMESDPPESVPGTSSEAPKEEDCHSPVEMPCGHVFGLSCIKEWLTSSNTCPMCRTAIESQDDYLRSIGEAPESGNFISDILDVISAFVPRIISNGMTQAQNANIGANAGENATANGDNSSVPTPPQQPETTAASGTNVPGAAQSPISFFLPLANRDMPEVTLRETISRTINLIADLQGTPAQTRQGSESPAPQTNPTPTTEATATPPNQPQRSASLMSLALGRHNITPSSIFSGLFRRHRNPPTAEDSGSGGTPAATSSITPPTTSSTTPPASTSSLSPAPPPVPVSAVLQRGRNGQSRHHPYRAGVTRSSGTSSSSRGPEEVAGLQCASISNLCIAENNEDGTPAPTLRLDCGHGYHEPCLRMYMRAHGDQDIPNLAGGTEDGATREVWCMRCRRYRNITNHV